MLYVAWETVFGVNLFSAFQFQIGIIFLYFIYIWDYSPIKFLWRNILRHVKKQMSLKIRLYSQIYIFSGNIVLIYLVFDFGPSGGCLLSDDGPRCGQRGRLQDLVELRLGQ